MYISTNHSFVPLLIIHVLYLSTINCFYLYTWFSTRFSVRLWHCYVLIFCGSYISLKFINFIYVSFSLSGSYPFPGFFLRSLSELRLPAVIHFTSRGVPFSFRIALSFLSFMSCDSVAPDRRRRHMYRHMLKLNVELIYIVCLGLFSLLTNNSWDLDEPHFDRFQWSLSHRSLSLSAFQAHSRCNSILLAQILPPYILSLTQRPSEWYTSRNIYARHTFITPNKHRYGIFSFFSRRVHRSAAVLFW